jgi:predicted nuclease with TOPRIM domain
MPKKFQSDDDDLMEIFQQPYAELRRENSEYEDTLHKLECEVAGLQGRVDQLEELNKRLSEERDQFLERYCRWSRQRSA